MSDRRRLPAVAGVVAVVAAVVAAGGAVDRRGEAAPADPATSTTLAPDVLASLAPAPSSLGSTWYCAGGTARDGGSADHRVVVVNPGEVAVEATLTVYAGGLANDDAAPDLEPVTRDLEVPARGRVAVRLADVVEAQFAAALVEVAGGEVVVEHVVRGGDDLDAAPCATTPSPTWYAASGQTTRDARDLLTLFNPFPDDAVVDIGFTTPEGIREVVDYQGFVVPAQRVVVVDVGAAVQRHPQVAITVAARAGRLVADRIQVYDGEGDMPAGLALVPTAPAAALLWQFPDGFKTDGLREVVTVYNPSATTAEVDVELVVDESPDPAVVTAVEPFQLSIPPGRFAQVDIPSAERVPSGLGHAIVVRSQNGVPVVAERSVGSQDPAPRTGYSATLGSPVVAQRWLTAVGGTGEGESLFLVVLNPSTDTIASVSIATPTPGQLLDVEGLQDLEVQPGTRLRIDLGEHVNRDFLPLVVTATQPVVVERGMFPVTGGIAQSMALPVSDATTPSVDTARTLP